MSKSIELGSQFKILHEGKAIDVMFATEFNKSLGRGKTSLVFKTAGHKVIYLKERKRCCKLIAIDNCIEFKNDTMSKKGFTILHQGYAYEVDFINEYANKQGVSRTAIQDRVKRGKEQAIRMPYGKKKLMLIIEKKYKYEPIAIHENTEQASI